MSSNTSYYWKRIKETEANPVAAYESKYQTQLDDALNAITNRKAFSYDFNADPMYQLYKDQYTKLGREASMNAAADVSALTGGFGNSYATTAASQANQQYLTRLNEVIPELYNLAMNRYKLEGDELNNKYNVLGQAEDRDYGQYRDKVSDWQTLLNYLQGAYGTQLAHDEWAAEYELKKAAMAGAGGGGGGAVYYSNGSGNGNTTTNSDGSLKMDILKNAIDNAVYQKITNSNEPKKYQSPSDRLETTILANRVANAVGNAQNQYQYLQDLTKAAKTVLKK